MWGSSSSFLLLVLAATWGVRVLSEPWHGQGCILTPSDVEGPFFQANVPVKEEVCAITEAVSDSLDRYNVSGYVYSSGNNCAPIPGAALEVWQANGDGEYDPHNDASDHWCRATIIADEAGWFQYQTEAPAQYAGRPVHIHYIVAGPGHARLVTQQYFTFDSSSETRSFSVRTDVADSTSLAANGAPLKTVRFDVVLEATAGSPSAAPNEGSASATPSAAPTASPSQALTSSPTASATQAPTSSPTASPTQGPTSSPTTSSTFAPTSA
eukprot:CAMPEP_0198221254 /NCGR_PEP_ID=MMETSP1445-20131203/82874_1 /TAXON_ID=36898 /ORGANISM="Pyramimonas sp., Strain CCMP2087" /LENGTH=267 /DNA_ID=CAMNT_0043899319 /DNA_START=149 /DNA_END=949 /DNA_ORIENTATION=-